MQGKCIREPFSSAGPLMPAAVPRSTPSTRAWSLQLSMSTHCFRARSVPSI